MLLNLTDILSLVSGHSGLSYWASGSLVTMTVNEEGTHLVPWHAGVTGVCPAGAGTAIWEHMEEAQAVNKCTAFSLLEETSSGWRPRRLPPFPSGHAEMQGDEFVRWEMGWG